MKVLHEIPDPVGASATAAAREQEKPVHDKPPDPWAQVQKLALRQLNRLVTLEPKVLRDEKPAAIHDLRVASRRLQEVLDLLYPAPRPQEIQKLRRKLQRARRALSEVRNCDVLLERVGAALARKRLSHGEAWEVLGPYLNERRTAAAAKGLRKLTKINLAAFYLHVKRHIAAGGQASGQPAPVGAPAETSGSAQVIAFPDGEETFHGRLAKALERDWQAFDAQVSASHGNQHAPLIHQVRIAAKRLRYLIEVVHEFEVDGSGEVLAWLRRLQQHLGNWHDLEILEQMTIEMIGRPKFLRDHLDTAMKVERLILRNRGSKKRLVQRYLGMTLASDDYRRLAQWVGRALSPPAA
jgi:CHAD domain-containing protein